MVFTLLAPAFLALWAGGGLLGAALVRAQLYHPAFGWAALGLAVVGIVGYLAGVFGPYWVLSTVFAPYAVAFTLWFLALGSLMLGDGRRPPEPPMERD